MATDQETLAEQFIAALEDLTAAAPGESAGRRQRPRREDRAALARLKRCAGRSLGECTKVYSLFYRLLPAGVHPADEESFFLIATLFPFAPSYPEGETGHYKGDIGHSLLAIRRQDPRRADGLDRRMQILLDCSREELPFRLRQIVHLVSSFPGVGVDWRRLLIDVLQWDHPDRLAQKRWAKSYFGAAEPARTPSDAAVAASM